MMIEFRKLSFGCGIVLFLIFMPFHFLLFAQPLDSTENELKIISLYVSNSEGRKEQSMNWIVSGSQNSDGKTELNFYSDSDERKKNPICQVLFYSDGSEELIKWNGLGKEKERIGRDGFLIVSGYPVPCDILPVKQAGNNKIYTVIDSVGGRQFKKTYRVSLATVPKEAALENGWLKANTAAGETQLRMISVFDDKEKTIVRQLWPLNGNWWVYEETPYRKSWKLP